MKNELYLAFIDNVGSNIDDKYVYQFYFSETPEVVWGEFWNVCPCSIIPNISPDTSTINVIYECSLDKPLNLVSENSCFSMQDCIDQIVALGWFDLNDNVIYEEKHMSFSFGEHYEYTEKKIKYMNSNFNKIWERINDSDDMINNLIDKLGDNEW